MKCINCELPIKKQVKIFYPTISKISKTRKFPSKLKLFERNKPKCIVNFLQKCSEAILRKDIELKPAQYKKLKPYKNHLLKLSNAKISTKKKLQDFKNKTGGFIGPLLTILAGILANTVIPHLIHH